MRAFLVLVIAFLASPALAQVQASTATILPSGVVRLTLTSSGPALLTAATLVDSQGQTFRLSGIPVGVKADIPGACKIGAPVNGTAVIPFNAAHGSPPYSLTIAFETPDSSQMFGCRSFSLSIDDLRP
jgi:hypothetical protein